MTIYPINSLYISKFYEKIIFSHKQRTKLIFLFISHILLLITLYIGPILYNNTIFNIFYLCLMFAMVCGWIMFRGECWINSWEKKILDPSYKNGENLDVNPSIDLLCNRIAILFGFSKFYKINDIHYQKYITARYMIPLVMPFLYFILFLVTRFPKLQMKYHLAIILSFSCIIMLNHYKWTKIRKKRIMKLKGLINN
jgi:hypothetical protein